MVEVASRNLVPFRVNPETDGDDGGLFDESRWSVIYRKHQEIQVAQAFRLFRSNGIEPVVFKGFALAPYYPSGKARTASDVDLAVSGKDYEPTLELARGVAERKLFIDVHRELRHLDTIPWNVLFARSRLVAADGEEVRVLAPEDHLRVVCVHWLNDGGEYRERLWDIYYLVANRPADFDWDVCLGSVSPVRRRWIECAVGLAAKYLGLDLKGTPLEGAADRLPRWLTRTIEREWASDLRLEPLQALVNEPRRFLKQLRKRIPPNPIQATIECEGSFDAPTRLGYQALSFGRRVAPSVERLLKR